MRIRTGLIAATVACAAVAGAAANGDTDCNGRIDAGDIEAIVARLFDGDTSAQECSADVNEDGMTTAADLVAGISYLVLPLPPTATPEPRDGPRIVHFGLAGADGTIVSSAMTDARGIPIYQRGSGSGFFIVVEAVRGSNGSPVGTTVFNHRPGEPPGIPSLQMQASRPLGNGDPAICVEGGVRGFDPPNFSATQEVADALNDFACGFSANTNRARACTINPFGVSDFVSLPPPEVQFCYLVAADKVLPPGDTTLNLQVQDVGGEVGPLARIVVRVGSQPVQTPTSTASVTPRIAGPTSTPTRTPTRTRTPSSTPTRSTTGTRLATATPTLTQATSPTRTPSPTTTGVITGTVTRTPTRTPTASRTVAGSPSRTPTASRTPTTSRTPTRSATASRTPTPGGISTVTRTPTATRTVTRTATATRTPTASRTLTATRTVTLTPLPTATPTITLTRTVTPTPTITRTPTVTRTPTPTVPVEPRITFFGVARADGTVVEVPSGMIGGVPIYERPSFGFSIVVEGRPGGTNAPLGTSTYRWDPGDPRLLPDLQVIVSKPLGNGSEAVCDDNPSMRGGVPASSGFEATQAVANAINDFGCRFKDAAGIPGARRADEACTQHADGLNRFWVSSSTLQYCSDIDRPFEFQRGEDTLVRVRIRDTAGNLSEEAQLFIRVPG